MCAHSRITKSNLQGVDLLVQRKLLARVLGSRCVPNGICHRVRLSTGLSLISAVANHHLSQEHLSGDSQPKHVVEFVPTVVRMAVQLPYTVDSFTDDVQVSFKNSVAATAGVPAYRVSINYISEAPARRRRLLTNGIVVDFSIRVPPAENLPSPSPFAQRSLSLASTPIS